MRERLQKILARAGVASRRGAEPLIAAGRVRVNGETVTELGTQADPDADRIELDGVAIAIAPAAIYLAMNKPAGTLTTARDPQKRRTVMELLPPGLASRVFPVGRLDRDTEGLLLFTNDGEFAHRMAHPRLSVEKEYMALVVGDPHETALQSLRSGVVIDEKRTAPASVERAAPPFSYSPREAYAWLRIVIHEGRKRQVRLMCAAVGHPVVTLVRTRIGDVALAKLAGGTTRPLSEQEVASLRRAVDLTG